jgi:hypothetical protein
MSATITSEEFDFLAKRAGYNLTPDQKAALISVYPHIAAMIARVHTPRGREAEPAHIFVPGQAVAP